MFFYVNIKLFTCRLCQLFQELWLQCWQILSLVHLLKLPLIQTAPEDNPRIRMMKTVIWTQMRQKIFLAPNNFPLTRHTKNVSLTGRHFPSLLLNIKLSQKPTDYMPGSDIPVQCDGIFFYVPYFYYIYIAQDMVNASQFPKTKQGHVSSLIRSLSWGNKV